MKLESAQSHVYEKYCMKVARVRLLNVCTCICCIYKLIYKSHNQINMKCHIGNLNLMYHIKEEDGEGAWFEMGCDDFSLFISLFSVGYSNLHHIIFEMICLCFEYRMLHIQFLKIIVNSGRINKYYNRGCSLIVGVGNCALSSSRI